MSNTPNPVYEKLMKCYESFRSQIDFQPEVALILGSGLGDFANDIRVTATLDYHDIEGFPVSTVPGHAGRFIFGYVGDVPVVCMQGRATIIMTFDIHGTEELNRITDKIRQIDGVLDIQRTTG